MTDQTREMVILELTKMVNDPDLFPEVRLVLRAKLAAFTGKKGKK